MDCLSDQWSVLETLDDIKRLTTTAKVIQGSWILFQKNPVEARFSQLLKISNVWIGIFIGTRLLFFDVIIIFGKIHSNQSCFTAIFPTFSIFINDPISVWSRPELPGFRLFETPGRVRPLQKFRIRPYHFSVQFWLLWLQISKISILNRRSGFLTTSGQNFWSQTVSAVFFRAEWTGRFSVRFHAPPGRLKTLVRDRLSL